MIVSYPSVYIANHKSVFDTGSIVIYLGDTNKECFDGVGLKKGRPKRVKKITYAEVDDVPVEKE